jgi:3-phosphoshikimate 1-carboxyvinyltransferase
MIYTIQAPKNIRTSVCLPASKSISNRILILQALSGNVYPVENISDSDDTKAMLNAFATKKTTIDVGAAGTSMRFLTAYFSQCEGIREITGTERMKNRPIGILVDALRRLGAEINYLEKDGFPPLQITGRKLKGGSITLDGSVSSQYLSALMMVAPLMENGLEIRLEGNIVSTPYIKMTIRLMELFGVKTAWDGNICRIAPQTYTAKPYRIENDWSAASYWYEIAALTNENPEITLQGLEKNSLQGDSKVTTLFEKLGIKTTFFDSEIQLHVKKNIPLSGLLEYDFTNEPDLAQTFVVTACLMDIHFRFSGLQSLRIKETDRIAALQAELKKLGYPVKNIADNALEWTGERCEPESEPLIASYEDHRMAMAFAPACLKAGKIRIDKPEVVSKSYPGFWDDLKKAGFGIE